MCFFRKLRKQIRDLTESNKKLTKIIESEELLRLRQKEKRLDFIEENLQNIKFKVKKARKLENQDTGNLCLKVEYEMPTLFIDFDDNNKLTENKTFKSINQLNLISYEDMSYLSKEISKE